METFEFIGEKYKKASKHQKEWGSKLMSELQLAGNEAILDLGCGDGVLSSQLAALVPEGSVLGIDASKGMIETAKKYEEANLNFQYMDINTMEFGPQFDVIFSNAALHWILDHERLIKASFQALKPGGVILWNFGGAGNCSHFLDVVRGKIKEQRYCTYFKDFVWPWYMPSKEEYEQLMLPAGFSRVTVTEENADRYFDDASQMIGWIDQPSLVPFMKYIPDELKENFRGEVITEMLEITQQPDGTCFETFRRIKVYAVK